MEHLESSSANTLMIVISLLLAVLSILAAVTIKLLLHIWSQRKKMETQRLLQQEHLSNTIVDLNRTITILSGEIDGLKGWSRGQEKRIDKLERKVFEGKA